MVGQGTSVYTVRSIMDRLASASYDSGECRLMNKVSVQGYGRVTFHHKTWLAHRFVYSTQVKYAFDGQHVHHLCGNKACINPEHLMAVSKREHQRLHQPPICQRGHDDWVTGKRGNSTSRKCRTCLNDGQRQRYRSR